MFKKRKGFSLVEVLIGLILLAVALLAIASSFTSSTKLMVQTVDKEKATFIAARTLDFIEGQEIDQDQADWGLSLSDLSSDVPVSPPFNVTWSVTQNGASRIIDLAVSWEGVTTSSIVSMSRELSPFGHETVGD